MKREGRFTCVDLFCAFFSLALLHRHHSHHHRTNTDGIGETYVANQQIGCVSESERCEWLFLFFFTSLLFLPRYTYPPLSTYHRSYPANHVTPTIHPVLRYDHHVQPLPHLHQTLDSPTIQATLPAKRLQTRRASRHGRRRDLCAVEIFLSRVYLCSCRSL